MRTSRISSHAALWAIGAADLGVLMYHVVREAQVNPVFFQAPLEHRIKVVVASVLLVAQIGSITLALSKRRLGTSMLGKATAALMLLGGALFNIASLVVLGLMISIVWKPEYHLKSKPGEAAVIALWVAANLFGFVAGWRRRPGAALPEPMREMGDTSRPS